MVAQEQFRNKPMLVGHGDEIAVIVRQYFADRTKEVPLTLNIARVDKEAPTELRHQLDRNYLAEGGRRAFANLEVRSHSDGARAMTALADTSGGAGAPRPVGGRRQATMTNTIRAHSGISMVAHNQFVCANGTNLFPTLDNRYMVLYLDELAPAANPDDSPVVLIRG